MAVNSIAGAQGKFSCTDGEKDIMLKKHIFSLTENTFLVKAIPGQNTLQKRMDYHKHTYQIGNESPRTQF